MRERNEEIKRNGATKREQVTKVEQYNGREKDRRTRRKKTDYSRAQQRMNYKEMK
jgi:hypothetical protein